MHLPAARSSLYLSLSFSLSLFRAQGNKFSGKRLHSDAVDLSLDIQG